MFTSGTIDAREKQGRWNETPEVATESGSSRCRLCCELCRSLQGVTVIGRFAGWTMFPRARSHVGRTGATTHPYVRHLYR